MKINCKFFLTVICAGLLFGCSADSKTSESQNDEATVVVVDTLPPLSTETYQEIRSKTDYIDIIFNYLPMSISVEQEMEIQTFFNFMAPKPFTNYENCRNEGMITFLAEGEIIGEAFMYYRTDCFGFVFHENQQKYASMLMNDMGKAYFAQIFASGQQMRKQMEQQQRGGQ